MNKIELVEVVPSLRNISSEFAEHIDLLVKDYGADDEVSWNEYILNYGGIYEVFNALSKYVSKPDQIKQREMKGLFDLIENWHLDGSDSLKEAVSVGFLEDLICLNASRLLEEEVTYKYMGKETKYWAQKVKDFWVNGAIIKDARIT